MKISILIVFICITFHIVDGTDLSEGELGQSNFNSEDDSSLISIIRNETHHLPLHRMKRQSQQCVCGKKNTGRQKIVGGSLTKQNTWPWMAALVVSGNPPSVFCGGSLINDRYVLTAAHCVKNLASSGLQNFRVYLGTNEINNTINATITGIQSVISHPRFNAKTLNFDFALLRLSFPLIFTNNVRPVCLGYRGTIDGKFAIVAGWGAQQDGGPTVNSLRETRIKVVSNNNCQKSYSASDIKITANMLCATAPGKDSCQGDSGGPLFIKQQGSSQNFAQIGVVSFGQRCAKSNFPGVYSRVGKALKWIQENTSDGIKCS